MHQVIEICNRKVPDFSSRIDSQSWTACQVWTTWPDPAGVAHGGAGLTDLDVIAVSGKEERLEISRNHKKEEIQN